MPRPDGIFTFDAALGRFRNAAGQLVADAVMMPPAGPSVSADDALEMMHKVIVIQDERPRTNGHVAGAATPEWLRLMAKQGQHQPCMGCGQIIGLGDVELAGTHSRDW